VGQAPAVHALEWGLQYNLRAPAFGAPVPVLYRAAVEQAAWADRLGCRRVLLPEHHGFADGYLPAPFVFAAAVAGRTASLRVRIAALILTLHDPLGAAEEVAVLDNVSAGRVDVVCGAGYVPNEFARFGIAFERRIPVFEDKLAVFGRAVTGEWIVVGGTRRRVTPAPVQRPRPPILLGGSTPAAARRAARLGDGFMPATSDPVLAATYATECERLGTVPGECARPGGPWFVHVAEDPDAVWPAVKPHVLHEITETAALTRIQAGDASRPPIDPARVTRLGRSFQVLSPDECLTLARDLAAEGRPFLLNPLLSGLAPDLAWQSLELFATRVLPRVNAASS
jgi:alkanesulfonate monooxygenase SsuD/methylene tetrahydromethanopterin reductase-like flavin-dependent oxidoreductase (luciferase family)